MNVFSKERNYIFFIALMTAFSTSLFLIEMFIPKPMLFMKIGLSNIVVLVMVYSGLYKAALLVAVLKSVMGAFFTGMIFSPTFLLSLLGALMSCLVMITCCFMRLKVSVFGLSVMGAFVHLTTQLVVVRLLIIQSNSVFNLYPIIAITSVITGLLTGLAGFYVMKHIPIKNYELGFRNV